jgi:hypothetical protein
MLDRLCEERLDGDSIAPYKKGTGWGELFPKCTRCRVIHGGWTAFNFDSGEPTFGAYHEVHLVATVAPVKQFACAQEGCIGQMCPNSRFDKVAPSQGSGVTTVCVPQPERSRAVRSRAWREKRVCFISPSVR